MKVTKRQLKQIIKEELGAILNENPVGRYKRLRALDKGDGTEYTVEEFMPLISQFVPKDYDTIDDFVYDAWTAGLVPDSGTDIDPGPERSWVDSLKKEISK
jgi:hypothetical protein